MLYLFIFLIFIYLKFCFKRNELYQDFRSYSVNATTRLETTKKLIFLRTNIFFISVVVATCTLFFYNDVMFKDKYVLEKLVELSNAKKTSIFKMSSLLYLEKLKKEHANM